MVSLGETSRRSLCGPFDHAAELGGHRRCPSVFPVGETVELADGAAELPGASLTLTKKSAAATVVVVGGTVVVVVGGAVVVVVGGSVVGGAVVGGGGGGGAGSAQEAASAAITKRAEARKGRGERLLSRGIDGHRKPLSDERSSPARRPDGGVKAAPYTRSATNPRSSSFDDRPDRLLGTGRGSPGTGRRGRLRPPRSPLRPATRPWSPSPAPSGSAPTPSSGGSTPGWRHSLLCWRS